MRIKILPFRTQASRLVSLTLLFLAVQSVSAQDNVGDDSTVVYPASYFAEFNPVTAQDMLDRIPGVGSATGGGGNFAFGPSPATQNRGSGGGGGFINGGGTGSDGVCFIKYQVAG